jgi:hypothetical protein
MLHELAGPPEPGSGERAGRFLPGLLSMWNLFVPQRFGGIDARRTARRKVCREERSRKYSGRDERERHDIGSAVTAGTARKYGAQNRSRGTRVL